MRGEGGGVINFPSLKRGGGLLERGVYLRGVLNRGFTVFKTYSVNKFSFFSYKQEKLGI